MKPWPFSHSPEIPASLNPAKVASLAAAGFLIALCALMLADYARMFHARLVYPLDLEWMEGGVLVHVQRLLDQKPLFVAPSVEFILFAYTPFYYVTVAALAAFLGVSFFLARLISLLALASIPVAIFVALRPAGSGTRMSSLRFPALAALIGLTLLLLEYFTTGAWLDLARSDTLYLALTLWAAVVLVRGPHRASSMILSGVLFSLAFWTKQTAFFFILAAGAWQTVRDVRRLAILAGVIALLCGGGMLLLQWQSDGWAWFYLRKIHQLHTFDAERAWSKTPLLLLGRLWPLLLLGGIGLARSAWNRRRPSADVLFWWIFAACGLFTAAIGSGTQWAHINALLPAAVFLPISVASSWAAWAEPPSSNPPRGAEPSPTTLAPVAAVRPIAHAALTLVGFAVLLFHLHTRYPEAREFARATPTSADARAARHFIRALRRLPGPILIPYHPWSAVLAGSPAHFHQHALSDIRAAGLPVPADFTEGLKTGRWKTIVHDRHGHVFWRQWPGFTRHYRNTSAVGGRRLRTWAGNACGPRTYWTPVAP